MRRELLPLHIPSAEVNCYSPSRLSRIFLIQSTASISQVF
jgi:hypothetical protein